MRFNKIVNGAAANSIILTFVRIITTVLGLVITKLLSVHFSLHAYGTYSQALLVTTTATSLSILGLTDATNYFNNRTDDIEKQKKYVSTIFTIQYIVGFTCAVVIFGFRFVIADYFSNDSLPPILIITALSPLFTNLIAMYQTLFVSIGQAKKIAIRNLLVSVIRLLAVIVACFVLDDIIIILVTVLIMDILQVVYFSLMFKRDKFFISVRNTDVSIVREILVYSIPMAVYVLTNSLTRDIDKYIISMFSNTEALAIYTNASKALPFDMLTISFITVLVPIITRLINTGNYDEVKKIYKLYLRMSYLMTFILVGGALAVAKYLMMFLYDEKYLPGLSIFCVYLVIDMIRFATYSIILNGAGKSKTLMVISISTLVANGLFNIIGYKLMGMIGPAIVTLILTVLMTFVFLKVSAKEIKTNIVSLFDFKEMFILLLEIAAMGTVSYFLSSFLAQKNVPLFFVLAISYGIYLLVLLGLNFKKIISTFKALNAYK